MKWESMEPQLILNYEQKDIFVFLVQQLQHLQMEPKVKDEIQVTTDSREQHHRFNDQQDHMNQEMELIQQLDKHAQRVTFVLLEQQLQQYVLFQIIVLQAVAQLPYVQMEDIIMIKLDWKPQLNVKNALVDIIVKTELL